jgi:hypothetical protein
VLIREKHEHISYIGWKMVDWSYLAKRRSNWRALAKRVTEFRVPKNGKKGGGIY